ncbi:interleukin-binding protein [Fowlpox virus]|uniref:ORF FPV073 Interleukin binding protein n=2 Tax=Fowlpox virus TaxID=10261 RepID=Q9J5D8_FOWPN|nr:Interleukin binding protein [Fowlpox virus]UNS14270.1 ALPV-106 [Albatrosspox virus]WPD90919.1 interleukin 18-binding protein [Avipoxvirus sp.]CAE52615.1 hypothetical protein [Fowlpox virus isolate HP-438/Munich]AAF44417.1 ORF FPV073 Interleukin binding protein [Fowlpox virus]ART91507.1 interleukin binding protein [Fowlpox virus]
MMYRTIFILCLIIPVLLNPIDYGDEGDYSTVSYEEDDSDETIFLDLEGYLPENARKNSDGVRECCPVTREDCTYVNITRLPEDINTTSLICVGCGRKGSSARMFWAGPGGKPISEMESVIHKSPVTIPLQNSTFFIRELLVDNKHNGKEFMCLLVESNTTVYRQLLLRHILLLN